MTWTLALMSGWLLCQQHLAFGSALALAAAAHAALVGGAGRQRRVGAVLLVSHGTAMCGWVLDSALMRLHVGAGLESVLTLCGWFGMDLVSTGGGSVVGMHSDGLLRFHVGPGLLASRSMLTLAAGLALASALGLVKPRPTMPSILAAAVLAMLLHAWLGMHLFADGENVLAGKGASRLLVFHSPVLQALCAAASWASVRSLLDNGVGESCDAH